MTREEAIGILYEMAFKDGAFVESSKYEDATILAMGALRHQECAEGVALTWKDMQYIVESADALIDELPKDKLAMLGSECYYSMVLDRYNAFRRKEENYG